MKIFAYAAGVLAMLAACGGGDVPSGYDDSPVSVAVVVVDTQGNPIGDALLSYSVDGSPARSGQCFPTGNCVAGQGEGGRFVITARKDGYLPATITVDVPPPSSSGPNPQSATIVLRPG